jgi:hypothetical protein
MVQKSVAAAVARMRVWVLLEKEEGMYARVAAVLGAQ